MDHVCRLSRFSLRVSDQNLATTKHSTTDGKTYAVFVQAI